jgi:hypothetical protein
VGNFTTMKEKNWLLTEIDEEGREIQ